MHTALVLLISSILICHADDIDYSKKWKEDLLAITSQRDINDKILARFRADTEGVLFSGVFTDNAVLQREPYQASLYGIADTAYTMITLEMIDEDTNNITKYTTTSMYNGDWKVTLPSTYPNGGNYTFTVSCANCSYPDSTDTIVNVTFGDIIFCAGQV